MPDTGQETRVRAGLKMSLSQTGCSWVTQHIYFLGHSNRLPPIWWLKTTQIYCFTVLEGGRRRAQVSLGEDPGAGGAWFLSVASGEGSVPLPFRLLEDARILCLVAPPPICKTSKGKLSPSHIISLWPFILPLTSTFKDPLDYTGPTETIQDNLLISRQTNHQPQFLLHSFSTLSYLFAV